MVYQNTQWFNPIRSLRFVIIILLILLLTLSCKHQSEGKEGQRLILQTEAETVISVAAFNIQVFGRSKMGKVGVPEILADIITRYDVILIQEIRDISETAVYELLDLVNAESNGEYSLLLSDRLGRTSSKEQYAYFYKTKVLSVLGTYHYDDGLEPDADIFEREPYLVRFQVVSHLLNFSMIGIHAAPGDAEAEVDYLVDVYQDMQTYWQETEVMLLGDFNADCTYISDSDQANIRLWQDSRFVWWIDDDADTTTKSTDCAYDRIVTHSDLESRIVADSAGVFRFDQEYGLSAEETEVISDHYPVEIKIRVDG